jgi:hypothetical protein
MKVSEIINENTGISIGLIIALAGAVSWMTTIYSGGEANAKAITRLEETTISLQNNIQQILINTTETKSKVEFLYEQQKEK